MSETRPRFFDIQATHNPNRWVMPVGPDMCVGPPGRLFLFGGIGLASSITAMEGTTGRKLVWATAQYLSFALPGEIVDLDVTVPVTGKHNSQARVIGRVGDREIFTCNGALGTRESEFSDQWTPMPMTPAPLDCPRVESWVDRKDMHARLETRLAKGRYGEARRTGGRSEDGHVLIWVRAKDIARVDSGLLAVFADFVPSGVGHAIGRNAGANSLDNTLRIREMVDTEWVLCDIRIHGVHAGFVHGRMLLFAENGTLMATASQSGIIRVHD